MIDLETLGNSSFCGIISIAAVVFDLKTGKTGDRFYIKIRPESNAGYKLFTNKGTIAWWNKQDKNVRREAFSGVHDLGYALRRFLDWCKGKEDYEFWGNSARFDLGILQNALSRIGKNHPWSPWNERCVRTYASLRPKIKEEMKFTGNRHNPIDDCLHQIKYCHAIYNRVKPKKKDIR